MVKARVSRIALAVSVVVALGSTAACGSGGEGSDGKSSTGAASKGAATPAAEPSGGASGSAADAGAGALGQAELEKAALASGDVKGYKVETLPAEDMPADSVAATPAVCQPLADMFMFTSQPKAAARAGRTLSATDSLDSTVTSLALLAHTEGGAKEVFSGLRTASKKCTAYEHTDFKYSEVTALPEPKAGGEAVAYRLKGSIDGSSVPMTFTVVRSGSTLVAFYAVNLLGANKTKVPDEVIDAQLAKLKKGGGLSWRRSGRAS